MICSTNYFRGFPLSSPAHWGLVLNLDPKWNRLRTFPLTYTLWFSRPVLTSLTCVGLGVLSMNASYLVPGSFTSPHCSSQMGHIQQPIKLSLHHLIHNLY